MISVSGWEQVESLSAVNRSKQPGVQKINRVRGFRISVDLAEIPCALTKATIIVYTGPMLSGIIGTIKAAFLCFDGRINAVGIGSRNCNANPSEDTFGQAIAIEPFPGDAIVFRSIKPTARTSARKKPRLPPRLPQRSENNIRIMRIKDYIDPAGVFVFRQDFRPGLPTVSGPKYSAFRIRTKRMTQGRHQDDVFIS